jgi:hypothetical protein
MAEGDRDASGGAGPEHLSAGTPRWVKVFGAVAAVIAILVVVLLLVGGNHGPGRHFSGDTGGEATPAGAHTPPPGGHSP